VVSVLVAPPAPSPTARPGWWSLIWWLVVSYFLLGLASLAVLIPASILAGINLHDYSSFYGLPFVPSGATALTADGAFVLLGLVFSVLVCGRLARWMLGRPIAATWVAVAVGAAELTSMHASYPGGVTGAAVALLTIRYGAFDPGGHARAGALDLLSSSARRLAVRGGTCVLALAVAVCAGYGITHPVSAYRGEPLQSFRVPSRPIRAAILPLNPRGQGLVDVEAVTAPASAGLTAAGAFGDGLTTARPRGLPLRLGTEPLLLWFAAPRCPAPPRSVTQLSVRTRSWTGIHTTPVRLDPPLLLHCTS